jgi:hypothetical protein
MCNVITLPWMYQVVKTDPDWHTKVWPNGYKVVYACPLCGWYCYHPLAYCGHCRGKLERLGIATDYLAEWTKGKRTDGT